MIYRVSEYVVRCDRLDCQESCAFGCDSRVACERSAVQHGWKPMTYKRWFCPRCYELARRKTEALKGVAVND